VKRRKKRRKSKKPQASRSLLVYQDEQVLVEFLNFDFSTLRYDGNTYTDAAGRKVSGELQKLIHRDLSLNLPINAFWTDSEGIPRKGNQLEMLQAELIEDLSLILEPAKDPDRDTRMQAHLISLCDRINRFDFKARLVPLSGRKKLFGRANPARQLLNREQRVFAAAGGQWIVRLDFGVGDGHAPEKDFYAIIADGLISGKLAMLRRCKKCRIFFLAKEPRQVFCEPAHGRLYYDDPTRAKKRVEDSRANRSLE
jgi:hypothetical protein